MALPDVVTTETETQLQQVIQAFYNHRCVLQTYPKDGCEFSLKGQNAYPYQCAAHYNYAKGRTELALSNDFQNSAETLQRPQLAPPPPCRAIIVEGPNLCDHCHAKPIIAATRKEFFEGTLDFVVRSATVQQQPAECMLTSWRCTNCEAVGRHELKLCKRHDGRNGTEQSKKLRAGKRDAEVTCELADTGCKKVQFEVGTQPTCVHCTDSATLARIIKSFAQESGTPIEYGYLPEAVKVHLRGDDDA